MNVSATPDTGNTPTHTTVNGSDMDTPTRANSESGKKAKKANIWDYFILLSENEKGNKVAECRGCGKVTKGNNTTNFHLHQRTGCPGLLKAFREG